MLTSCHSTFQAAGNRFDNTQVEVINAGNENLLNHKIEATTLPAAPKQAFTNETGCTKQQNIYINYNLKPGYDAKESAVSTNQPITVFKESKDVNPPPPKEAFTDNSENTQMERKSETQPSNKGDVTLDSISSVVELKASESQSTPSPKQNSQNEEKSPPEPALPDLGNCGC